MTTTNTVDAARVELLLSELRLLSRDNQKACSATISRLTSWWNMPSRVQ
jgi:hypothetical protein